ncbi:Tn3 family transposase [Streptomyces sp. NPDC007905]|uniref:Tn3 family transposase n=1 Tax=Streptomyces sp. NPDC007905 TaxID=3364788 RepID=UPI0036E5C4F6
MRTLIRAMPGNVNLESVLREIRKLTAIGAVGLSAGREEAEMAALCLRILQASLVYVKRLMLQDVLAEPSWAGLLGPADRRGLTPLFWSRARPYGEIRIDLGSRLVIGPAAAGR